MTKHRLDRTMDDFGGELARAVQAPQRVPRRLRLGLAAGAAAAATALLAWPGADSGGGLDVIAQARAALAPSDEIIHLVLTNSSQTPGDDRPPIQNEQWSASNPTRWRVVSHVPVISTGELQRRDPKLRRPPVTRVESAFANGELRSFNARDNSMSIERDVPGVGQNQAIGPFGGDPVSRLRAMLVSGQLRDAGTVQSGGRTVRRLVGSSRGVGRSVEEDGTPRAVTFDVDPESFAPMAGSSTIELSGDRRIVRRFRVDRYERLPLNERTAKLLRIATDADTKVAVSDATP